MPRTYDVITTSTVSGTVNTITFDNIPQTYTDLVLVTNCGANPAKILLNNDTGNNYDEEFFAANESQVVANQSLNDNFIYGYYYGPTQDSTTAALSIFEIANYANSSYYTTVVTQGAGTTHATGASVTLNSHVWKNTAAVTRIDIKTSSGNFYVGSTFTLYGILAA